MPDSDSTHSQEDQPWSNIVEDEERVLARVMRTVLGNKVRKKAPRIDYDAELISLRDQIREARTEDIPPLVEEMERLTQVASRRAQVTQGSVDARSPYFGRLVLEEDDKKREVLIGRGTYLDSKTGVRIVDWRDAPISRIYYRYEEGDDYDEVFGGREVEGDVLVRRSLVIKQSELRRITCPAGAFRKNNDGSWRAMRSSATALSGGQGAALRPESHQKIERGTLGIGNEGSDEKYLSEITALIDPVQFDLISKPQSGLVVIQGGAGSGKTTIGLHRLAYLAFQDKRRYSGSNMMVIVFNAALVRYISRVLPALGVEGVKVATYEDWAAEQRHSLFPALPRAYAEDTPGVVVRYKKDPAMLRLIDGYAEELADEVEASLRTLAADFPVAKKAVDTFIKSKEDSLFRRILDVEDMMAADSRNFPFKTRVEVEALLSKKKAICRDVVGAWFEVLTNSERVNKIFAENASGRFNERELSWAMSWCGSKCAAATVEREERLDAQANKRPVEFESDDDRDRASMDREDDALLLRLFQRLNGPLHKKRKLISYEHMFIDETQDLSPVELSVLLATSTEGMCVTLAGDVAQKLILDNGFSNWETVLRQLGLAHVNVEPLKLSYRSTHEIIEFSTHVLGPLKNEVSGQATRHGAPVELFQFGDTGEAVGFLAEALRNLVRAEPMASICVIARYPEQADIYYKGLLHGEVPNMRRIAEQDFPFRPGIDVTDVRQVKGLEFDYVIIVEASASVFPEDNASRHLMHIAATRGAHQLWVITTDKPSALIPTSLVEAAQG